MSEDKGEENFNLSSAGRRNKIREDVGRGRITGGKKKRGKEAKYKEVFYLIKKSKFSVQLMCHKSVLKDSSVSFSF